MWTVRMALQVHSKTKTPGFVNLELQAKRRDLLCELVYSIKDFTWRSNCIAIVHIELRSAPTSQQPQVQRLDGVMYGRTEAGAGKCITLKDTLI
jgi:hypothetical protein